MDSALRTTIQTHTPVSFLLNLKQDGLETFLFRLVYAHENLAKEQEVAHPDIDEVEKHEKAVKQAEAAISNWAMTFYASSPSKVQSIADKFFIRLSTPKEEVAVEVVDWNSMDKKERKAAMKPFIKLGLPKAHAKMCVEYEVPTSEIAKRTSHNLPYIKVLTIYKKAYLKNLDQQIDQKAQLFDTESAFQASVEGAVFGDPQAEPADGYMDEALVKMLERKQDSLYSDDLETASRASKRPWFDALKLARNDISSVNAGLEDIFKAVHRDITAREAQGMAWNTGVETMTERPEENAEH